MRALSAHLRRVVTGACLAGLLAAAPAAAAQEGAQTLRRTLASAMAAAGPGSGAYVLNATDRDTLFELRPRKPRILASNVKLFTTAAALARFGPEATLPTAVLGVGTQDLEGVWHGDLYLRGGGDPTFGSRSFVRRSYGAGAEVEELAAKLAGIGILEVRGRVFGDESRFDPLRGGPASGFGPSIYVGPLSALSFNRGLANERGRAFQRNPPGFAAARLDEALAAEGIYVSGAPRVGVTPPEARQLVAVESPSMARLVQVTNKRSDNFFAEVLLKGLGRAGARPGSTAAGARAAAAFARRLGARASLVDGSGLARANQSSPRNVAELLDEVRSRPEFPAFFDSLPIAGRDGTLDDRMRRRPARGRCRAKTGTLVGVSTLSGYCRSRGGDTIVFSFLMNGVFPSGARRLQDRMANALAGYRG